MEERSSNRWRGQINTNIQEQRQSVLSRGMPFALRAPAPEGRSAGAFAGYANPALRAREAKAFAKAMEAKHARPA